MDTQTQVSSSLQAQGVEMPKLGAESENAAGKLHAGVLGSGSFTTFWTWRGHGVVRALRFSHASIKANSRVFVSISEFDSDAAVNRFIGDAKMTVSNVAPFNGGFLAWVEVSFNTALNVRFDVLVDP